jgi:hypothetical protein
MHHAIILCLTTDNYIGIFQGLATLAVGIATILIYLRITRISAAATRQAGQLSADATTAAAALSAKNLLFNKLNQDLDRIVEYTIKYPYFEDESYTHNQYRYGIVSSVPEEKEKALRYDLFAIMNFNFVEDLFKYFDGNEEEMSNVANYTELVESHAEYWKYRIVEQREQGYTLIKPLVNRILGIKNTN